MSETLNPELHAAADEIAQALGEKDFKPRQQIYLIARLCGLDYARELLTDAQEIEANGGQLVTSGERRRTLGGIFFNLARQRLDEDLRQTIFFTWRSDTLQRIEREASYAPFDYHTERAELIPRLKQEIGKVEEVRIILVGLPKEIERRRNLVILTMQDQIKEAVSLPAGVPQPDPAPMDYTVYAASKQWDRVEEALAAYPQDEAVIEGVCAYDAETNSVAVFAMNATTRRLQKKDRRAVKHQKRLEEAQAAKAQKQTAKGKSKPTARKTSDTGDAIGEMDPPPRVPAAEVKIELPPGIPDEPAQKLLELHKAAATFREKIAMLESKPEDQRFGLEMTQKLLKNTESQIEKLEKQYSSSGN